MSDSWMINPRELIPQNPTNQLNIHKDSGSLYSTVPIHLAGAVRLPLDSRAVTVRHFLQRIRTILGLEGGREDMHPLGGSLTRTYAAQRAHASAARARTRRHAHSRRSHSFARTERPAGH